MQMRIPAAVATKKACAWNPGNASASGREKERNRESLLFVTRKRHETLCVWVSQQHTSALRNRGMRGDDQENGTLVLRTVSKWLLCFFRLPGSQSIEDRAFREWGIELPTNEREGKREWKSWRSLSLSRNSMAWESGKTGKKRSRIEKRKPVVNDSESMDGLAE